LLVESENALEQKMIHFLRTSGE